MKLLPISTLFNVKYGVNLELINLTECAPSDPEAISFVSRTEKNNGISAYVKKEPGILPNPAMTISVAGGGSVLSTFLQKEKYYSGRDVYVLIPKKAYTEYELLFYVYSIRQNKYRYNYGRQANKTLDSLRIPASIPTNWQLPSKRSLATLTRAPLTSPPLALNTDSWKYFYLDNGKDGIFTIKKGKRLTKSNQSKGDIPYVSSSSVNNGVDNTIGNGFTDENCISFACYGSIGEAFYQKGKVWISDNANVFYVRDRPLNPYVALFLTTVLRLEKYRFSYGMTAKKERLQGMRIKLPVDSDGQPAWGFMEAYIKGLTYSSNIEHAGKTSQRNPLSNLLS